MSRGEGRRKNGKKVKKGRGSKGKRGRKMIVMRASKKGQKR